MPDEQRIYTLSESDKLKIDKLLESVEPKWDLDKILSTAGKVIAFAGWVLAIIIALKTGQPVPQPPPLTMELKAEPGSSITVHEAPK